MSTIEVRQLRVLVALAKQGGVTAAAQSLGLAQSTVSEALAALERAVGAPVLLRRRGAHDSVLTDAGQALLPHARDVLASLESAHLAVAQVSGSARATIAIAANESIGTYLLPRALPAVRARWPNTRFAVSVATCPASGPPCTTVDPTSGSCWSPRRTRATRPREGRAREDAPPVGPWRTAWR